MDMLEAMTFELLERPAINDPLEGRLYPNQIERREDGADDYPCLVFRRRGLKQFKGVQAGTKAFVCRVFIEVYARGSKSYTEARDIIAAVRSTLTNNDKGFRGKWGDNGDGAVEILGCMADDDTESGSEWDDFLPAESGQNKGVDVITLVLKVTYIAE